MIAIAVVIGIYWLYLRNTYGNQMVYGDFMNQKVIDIPFFENCCSWWPISHFVLFLILGFLFPNCVLLIITLGIVWELIEVMMGKLVVGDKWQRQPLRQGGNVEYTQDWWAGSAKDILFNIAGFGVGFLLAKAAGRTCSN